MPTEALIAAPPKTTPQDWRQRVTGPDDPELREQWRKECRARAIAKQLDAAEKKRKALEMRLQGASYPTIAKELGYKSHSSAYDVVMAAIAEIPAEPAEKVKALELHKLDRLEVKANQGLLRSQKDGKPGDPRWIDVLTKIGERRSKLKGLDVPTRIDAQVSGGVIVLHTDLDVARVVGTNGGNGDSEPKQVTGT
jgi:hypothetical protein